MSVQFLSVINREMAVGNLSLDWRVRTKDLGKMTFVMELENRLTQIRMCMKVDGNVIRCVILKIGCEIFLCFNFRIYF